MREIGVELSVTRNLGDFNSLRVQASFKETLTDDEVSLDDAYASAWAVVEAEVQAKIQEALSS